MKDIRVAESGDLLLCGDKPFFYLADTVWSAFSKITFGEWEEYLQFRKAQNFNALQINILPQWDRSMPDLGIHPFKVKPDGLYDYAELNEAYFQRAEKMVEMAVSKGFLPVLVVLWSNYVKGTMHSQRNPANVMPLDRVSSYVKYAVSVFEKFKPMYILGGDTNYPSDETIRYYTLAAETIRALSPQALLTTHSSPIELPPSQITDSGLIDFYMYQSGHERDCPERPYKLARQFYEMNSKKPVINGEPCYEGMGDAFSYGRNTRFDTRRAMWQSLLSGAKAGITYGSHGVWSWYSKGCSCIDPFGDTPFQWRAAMHFPGAWDASFIRLVFEKYALYAVEPLFDLEGLPPEVRVSRSKNGDRFAAYIPYSRDLLFDVDPDSYEFTLINLEDRLFLHPEIQKEDGRLFLPKHEFNSDALLIGTASQ